MHPPDSLQQARSLQEQSRVLLLVVHALCTLSYRSARAFTDPTHSFAVLGLQCRERDESLEINCAQCQPEAGDLCDLAGELEELYLAILSGLPKEGSGSLPFCSFLRLTPNRAGR